MKTIYIMLILLFCLGCNQTQSPYTPSSITQADYAVLGVETDKKIYRQDEVIDFRITNHFHDTSYVSSCCRICYWVDIYHVNHWQEIFCYIGPCAAICPGWQAISPGITDHVSILAAELARPGQNTFRMRVFYWFYPQQRCYAYSNPFVVKSN